MLNEYIIHIYILQNLIVFSFQALIILDNSNRIDYQKAFEILKSNGYKHIPFWGLTPGADWPTTTSIFLKNIEILPDAHYVKNSYDIFDF